MREVAAAKTAVLRMSVESLTRHGMPFVGETRDVSRPSRRATGPLLIDVGSSAPRRPGR